MGTADEIIKVPEKGHVFMKDLSEEEQVAAVLKRNQVEWPYIEENKCSAVSRGEKRLKGQIGIKTTSWKT
nr:ubiquitin carboxyl-terminal hydrolase 6 [Tanacetum cinerariifolium]